MREWTDRFNFTKVHLGVPVSFDGGLRENGHGQRPATGGVTAKETGQVHGTFKPHVRAVFLNTALFAVPKNEDCGFATFRG